MPFDYPIVLDLAGAPVLVVGGGRVAKRKIDGLVAAPDGSLVIRDSISHLPEHAEDAAGLLADRLLARGGRSILEKVR